MELTPWRTYSDPARPRGLFHPIFDELWGVADLVGGRTGVPAVEVLRRGDDVVIRAEIAGVEPQDVDVRLTDDTATIRGGRRADADHERDGYYRSERQYGTFARSVALPAPVDASRARARFRHGLLEVVAPCRAEGGGQGRKVEVEVQH